MYCFFCSRIIPKEEHILENCNEEEEKERQDCSKLFTEISNDYEDSRLNRAVKHILKISHYLQIPINKIEVAKEVGCFSNFCQHCEQISENLGELCGLLEVTQMKINYFLNLLTDQILQKEEELDNQQVNLLKFQEVFHNKCLAKAAKITPNPELQLSKYLPPPLENNIINFVNESDNFDDHEENECKPVNFQSQASLQKCSNFTCDFCPLKFPNLRNKNRHIQTTHIQGKTSAGHLVKACEYCKAMLSTRNLSKHIKTVHGIDKPPIKIQTIKSLKKVNCSKCEKEFYSQGGLGRHLRESLSCGDGSKRKAIKIDKNRYECSSCKRRFGIKDNLKRHLKTNCKTGSCIDRGTDNLNDEQKDEPIVAPKKFVTEKQTKFPCGFCPLVFNNLENQERHIETSHVKRKTKDGYPIKACEYCGAMMGSNNLRKHKRNVHGVGKFGLDPNLVKKYERCVCGKIVRDINMKVHKTRCKGKEKIVKCRVIEKKPRKKYYYEKKPPLKCNICEKMIGYRNMSAHKTKVHGMNLYRW